MRTFDGCGMTLFFKKFAQSRVTLECDRFNKYDRILQLHVHHGLDGRNNVARSGLYPNGTPAPEKPDRVALVCKPTCFAGELIAIDANQLKGIIRIVDRLAKNMAKALIHEARVGTKEEIESQMRLWLRQKLVSLPMANRNHVSVPNQPRGAF